MNEPQDVNTKAALLSAAIEVFADKGFDSATVRNICSQAQANVAAVNYHYGSKSGLYAAVLEEIFPKKEDWQKLDSSTAHPEARLHEFVRGLVAEIYRMGSDMTARRWAIFLREMAKPSKHLDFIVRRQVQARTDELRHIVAELLGPNTPETTMAFCSANVWALILDQLLIQPILERLTPNRPGMDENIDAFVDHVVKFSLGGINAVKK
ncbi:CerR family C-terminal domain-containing protein [Pseudodesulfovibrio sp. JC047]|uniref:TetR/AcrR family transcriptional regulator n=1 Tax=Pseudodesulfovibrio sp. JC047 TaxID=2683199 RepID=UPI0013D2F49D|nr:CerR family C-terminal domain-containing protein [Pseudodesulfovibrio sp. JC047]NDV18532.1 CerR family C-terminal domain-containing protein [Pseudodesulfovibrio sp. JC047]